MRGLSFNRQQLRGTAAGVLAAWVLSVCCGVAHACLVPAAAAQGSSDTTLSSDALSQRAAVPAQEPTRHDPHADSHEDTGKDACLKSCVDESSALTKDKVSPADLPETLSLARLRWPQIEPASALVPWRQAERPASVGPPLFLRLLRMTL